MVSQCQTNWWKMKKSNRWQPILALVILGMAILACARAPEDVVRHYTPTPTVTPLATELPSPTQFPPIVIVATEAPYIANVLAVQLEIRSGPGTQYPANPDLALARGDQIMVYACVYDKNQEAWINFGWPAHRLFGGAAVTWRGAIFIQPMPMSCKAR